MKKYKIRVRVLPENICCGFIIKAFNIVDVNNRMVDLLMTWDFVDFEFISIGEL